MSNLMASRSAVPMIEPNFKQERFMLSWALTFFIIAIIAGILGFGGIAGASAGIAKILFFVFLVAFLISIVAGRKAPV